MRSHRHLDAPRTVVAHPRTEQSTTALEHSRAVAALVFGAPKERSFDIGYWDGSVERGGHRAEKAFRVLIQRPGALRRMLLPPSEVSIVEAFLSGDVDVDGALE